MSKLLDDYINEHFAKVEGWCSPYLAKVCRLISKGLIPRSLLRYDLC